MIDVSPWKKLLQFQTDLLSEWYTFNKQPFLYEIQEKKSVLCVQFTEGIRVKMDA